MISSRTVLTCAVLGFLSLNSGCSLLYELQPHRIQRLNRGAAPSIDPEFSDLKPKRQIHMVQKEGDPQAPTLSVNSAEVVVVGLSQKRVSLRATVGQIEPQVQQEGGRPRFETKPAVVRAQSPRSETR